MAKQSTEIFRFYDSAEAYLEDLSGVLGTSERVIKMRFKTKDVSSRGESNGTTPWVTFTPETLEFLSKQLASLVETTKQWASGSETPPSAEDLGVVVRREKGSLQ